VQYPKHQSARAFTLLEVGTAAVVIAILLTLLLPVFAKFRARAQRVQCTANLKSLYVAAESYIQEHGSWPQIGVSAGESDEQDYAQQWIAALRPFGPTEKTWICPTVQALLEDPDYMKAENARVDYIATTFDAKPGTPHQWSRQPWFAEMADAHGHGNLIIFTDGSVSDLKSMAHN
jgi:type II secretory pathway pseudopilin PulG